MKSFVAGIGTGRLKFPRPGLRRGEADAPRLAAIPEAGDFQLCARGRSEGDSERGVLDRVCVAGGALALSRHQTFCTDGNIISYNI